jgi:diacylglycerol kinase family enzyme
VPLSGKIYINKNIYTIQNSISIIITKQPYYGYGMKVMPYANFDDGLLHIGIFPSGMINMIGMIALSFSIGNTMGYYYITHEPISLNLLYKHGIQIDGELAKESKYMKIGIIEKGLKIIL